MGYKYEICVEKYKELDGFYIINTSWKLFDKKFNETEKTDLLDKRMEILNNICKDEKFKMIVLEIFIESSTLVQ